MLYRFVFLDNFAEPVSEQRLSAQNDAEALELARLLARPFTIEVSQDGRRVGIALSNKERQNVSN